MRVLFGRRVHPHADRIVALQTAAGASQDAAEWAAKLGRAFPHYTPGTRGYRSPARAPGRLDLLAQSRGEHTDIATSERPIPPRMTQSPAVETPVTHELADRMTRSPILCCLPTGCLEFTHADPDPSQRTARGGQVDVGPEIRRRASGALNLDIDTVASLIGGWRHDFFGVLPAARNIAVAMAEAHLRSGSDVVLPQLLTILDEAQSFELAAERAGAAFVEIALSVGPVEQMNRFAAKAQVRR